jgi:Glycosyl hydrolase family 9
LLTGIVKMTIPTAFTTTMLAWSMLSFPKAYTAAGTVDRTMSQVGWGADYLTKTFTTSVAATNTTNGTTGSIVYQARIDSEGRNRQAASASFQLLCQS